MNKLTSTIEGVNNGQSSVILTGKSDVFLYRDKKKVSDEPIGTKFDISLCKNRLCPLAVKIEGADPLSNITDEEIGEAIAAGKYTYVRFVDCVVSLYTINGNMSMSAKAKGIEVVSNGKEK